MGGYYRINTQVFRARLKKAMREYEIGLDGFAQKDLLPVAVLVAGNLLDIVRTPAIGRPTMCISKMNKDQDRRDVIKEMEEQKDIEIEPYECMVDIFCCTATEPYRTLLTIESEGASGHGTDVGPKSTPEDCDYLWDLFKLLQVPSPLRVFITLCTEKDDRIRNLEERIACMVDAYIGMRKKTDKIFSVVFPAGSLTKKDIRIFSWPRTDARCTPLRFG